MNTTLILIVSILVMFMLAFGRSSSSNKQKSKGGSAAGSVDTEMDSVVDNTESEKIIAELNSTKTDVRGANGIKHGEGMPDCPHPSARLNLLNAFDRHPMRELGVYGEEVLHHPRDLMDNRAVTCTMPKSNNTVMCVKKLVDEARPELNFKDQLDEDAHILHDFILPVDVQYQTYE